MSSFVLDPKDISKMATALLHASRPQQYLPQIYNPDDQEKTLPWHHGELYAKDAKEAASLGETLYEMNINATMQRYPNDTRDTLPGTYQNDKLAPFVYTVQDYDIESLYDTFASYLYQCAEGDVYELPLYAAIKAYHDAIAHKIARRAADEMRAVKEKARAEFAAFKNK